MIDWKKKFMSRSFSNQKPIYLRLNNISLVLLKVKYINTKNERILFLKYYLISLVKSFLCRIYIGLFIYIN